ncbi:transcription antitermination factor NusB [Saccharophagus sp. K07]|jgi:N utilization substance protein B|uniref:transcription antitermination factor NusB n=1 Tax=Saccharophagus sp. K07 TaxID=2283636 RepID=UPI0016523837|nr:transcription antitermination factor NusB [Saccharophagus sp. K07]MBC6904027.1 transcription antitermination factor NusB [Saccharophagus sp. K07]
MSKEEFSTLPAQRSRARHYAMQALYQWSVSKNPLSIIEAEFHADNDMSKIDVAYFHELLHQVPANLAVIETDFLPFVTDLTLDQIDPITLALLRMGTYELRYRLDVPYRVVINEALRLAKKFGATDSYKFINGVLDRVAARLRTAEIQQAR